MAKTNASTQVMARLNTHLPYAEINPVQSPTKAVAATKAGAEKCAKLDRPVKKAVARSAKPMIQNFKRSGSVRSLMETQTAPVAAVMAASNPKAAPMARPV